jgi:rubredoxin
MGLYAVAHSLYNQKTQIANDTMQKRRTAMYSYECPCAYVYEPDQGDPDSNISMGTPFEELPEDWVCPKCHAEKEFFEKLD